MNTTAVKTAEHAERQQETNQPDPFPPEGTDEKTLKQSNAEDPLSDTETLKATRAALDANADDARAEDIIDADLEQPNDPAEGRRDDEPEPRGADKIPSTHVPDNRSFDL